jgi:hypothetical protein
MFLAEVAKFESHLRSLPAWRSICAKAGDTGGYDGVDNVKLCDPGVSLANYALPTLEVPDGSIVPTEMQFNGSAAGRTIPIGSIIRLLQQFQLGEIVLPKGYEDDLSAATSAKMFRSVFRFRQYCCTNLDPPSVQKAWMKKSKEEWEKFQAETLLQFLREAHDEEDEDGNKRMFGIYWSGNGFEEMETMDALWNDVKLAGGAMGFVLFYLIVHTQSLFLGLMSLIIVFMAVPVAYVLFAILSGSSTMSLASFLSLFLVVGLGSDVVFVYTDFWRKAERDTALDTEADMMLWTLMYAGKASLATTVTTALSFFANLVSVLRPLREFGMFMGLCVVFAWILITLIFLPLCAVDSRYFSIFSLRCRGESLEVVHEDTARQRSFGMASVCVRRFRNPCAILSIVFSILALVIAILNAELDTSVPNIFPEDHNQNHGKEVHSRFLAAADVFPPLFAPPPVEAAICREHEFRPDDVNTCSVFWCEADTDEEASQDGSCKCWRKDSAATTCTSDDRSEIRFVGPESFTNTDENTVVHTLQL